MRLFIAIDIPDHVRRAVQAAQHDVDGVAWVPWANLHCTLRFIGEVDDAMATSIVETISKVDISPFPAHVRGVGCFPATGSRQPPSVLWAGVEHSAPLLRVVTNVELVLRSLGLQAERRPFHGHVTLGRCRHTSWDGARTWVARHADLDAGSWTVDSIRCYRSTLTDLGSRYDALS